MYLCIKFLDTLIQNSRVFPCRRSSRYVIICKMENFEIRDSPILRVTYVQPHVTTTAGKIEVTLRHVAWLPFLPPDPLIRQRHSRPVVLLVLIYAIINDTLLYGIVLPSFRILGRPRWSSWFDISNMAFGRLSLNIIKVNEGWHTKSLPTISFF